MKYNPQIHHRRSIRLKGYDYSQAGLCFVTICVQNRACLFGEITNGKMNLNNAGQMIETEWLNLHERFKNIHLHEYIVMPNHFHAILKIVTTVGAPLVVAQNEMVNQNNDTTVSGQPQGIAPTNQQNGTISKTGKTLGDMVGAFESITTVNYIRGVKTHHWPSFDGKLWQRNYWEHIIRDEQSYQNISEYIINNPAKWNEDRLYR